AEQGILVFEVQITQEHMSGDPEPHGDSFGDPPAIQETNGGQVEEIEVEADEAQVGPERAPEDVAESEAGERRSGPREWPGEGDLSHVNARRHRGLARDKGPDKWDEDRRPSPDTFQPERHPMPHLMDEDEDDKAHGGRDA